jgi:hypothetical protein
VADFRFASQLCLFVFPEGKIPNLQVTELSSYQLETLYGAWTTMFDESHGSMPLVPPASSTPPPPQQRLEWLRHHHGSRGSGIIDPTSATTTARGAPASSTCLRRNNGSRGSVIIDQRKGTCAASSTPPSLQQRLEGLRHHQPRLRYNNGSRSPDIINPVSATVTA